MPIRPVLFLACILPSTFALFMFSITQRGFGLVEWPGVLGLLPWCWGFYGVAGLIGAGAEPQRAQSAYRLRMLCSLLAYGIGGALIYAVIFVFLLYIFTGGGEAKPILLIGCIIFLIFPLAPLVVSIREFFRLRRESTLYPLPKRAFTRSATVLTLLRMLVVGGRWGMQEAVIYWYGDDLGERAAASAQVLAEGRPFCVIHRDPNVASLLSLDGRAEVEEALRKRRPNLGRNQSPKSPHFGVHIGEATYWWSFKMSSFYPEPEFWESYPKIRCNG